MVTPEQEQIIKNLVDNRLATLLNLRAQGWRPQDKLSKINHTWTLNLSLQCSWRGGRRVYDPQRNRDLSPWLVSRELLYWLDGLEVGLIYGTDKGDRERD